MNPQGGEEAGSSARLPLLGLYEFSLPVFIALLPKEPSSRQNPRISRSLARVASWRSLALRELQCFLRNRGIVTWHDLCFDPH